MENITDEKLYSLCKLYGAQALEARRKFIGLLPEVNRRRLFEKKGFGSIFEFAFKLCGLSEEQVRRVLNLEKRFEDKPVLHQALVNGEVSINKLSRIASIATPQNESILLEQAKILSQNALEILVKDEKQDGLSQPLFETKPVRAHRFELAGDVEEEFLELQEKGIDVNNLLREILAKRFTRNSRRKTKNYPYVNYNGANRQVKPQVYAALENHRPG